MPEEAHIQSEQEKRDAKALDEILQCLHGFSYSDGYWILDKAMGAIKDKAIIAYASL